MLEQMCAALGIELDELGPDSINTAFYYYTQDVDGIVLHPALKGKERDYTLAHEIGHAMLGAYSRYTPQEKRAEMEKQADIFASILLALLSLKETLA